MKLPHICDYLKHVLILRNKQTKVRWSCAKAASSKRPNTPFFGSEVLGKTLPPLAVLLALSGTRSKDVVVDIQRQRLTVRLVWCGRVLDGPLYRNVKPSEACWSLDSTPLPSQSATTGAAAGGAAGGAVGGAGEGGRSKSKGSLVGEGGRRAQKWSELIILLPKEDAGHYWRGLFEGGEEKSHFEVSRGLISKVHNNHHWACVFPILTTYMGGLLKGNSL
jgi:hypothetical protein